MTHGPVHLPVRDQHLRQALRQCFRNTACVAAAFTAIVAIAMLIILVRERPEDLATQTRLDQLKQQLVAQPTDAMKATIRDEDLRLRVAYFTRRATLVHGAWMLVGGAVVLVISVKLAWDLAVEPYLPTGPAPDDAATAPKIRFSLTTAAVVIAAALLLLYLPIYRGTRFKQQLEAADMPSASVTPSVTAVAELPPDAWPAFRGPNGIGVTSGDYPVEWNGSSGKNIIWKTAVPLAGNSSPIVCGGRVFLTGGSAERREIYCFNAHTGSLQWTRQVGSKGGPELKLAADTGWAPSTMSTDGARVFAIFPTGDLACFTLEGSAVWSENLGLPNNIYGHASSLLTWQGLLFIQLDQGATIKEASSAMLAIDASTGKQMWKVNRPVIASWSTPAIVKAQKGSQLVTLADPWIIAYEPETGTEIWRAKGLSGEIAPSPAFANGFLYAATAQSRLFQIRLDGHGDVTQTHVKKIDSDALPDIVSPLAVGERIVLVQTSGTIGLVDPTAGKDVWTHDIETTFHASPIAVGDKIYLTDGTGVTRVIALADQYKELATFPLGEEVMATPAFSGGRIFIRGQKSLFCVGGK